MNRHTVFAVAALALVGFSATALRSQDPPAPGLGLEALEAIKAKNAALLDRQAKTLEALEALEEEARQIKVYAKRS